MKTGEMTQRLEDAARQYRVYAPVPRIAFFDYALPLDSAEYNAMNGYAILLVTAVTQDSTELPLSRVYLDGPDGKVEMQEIRSVLTRLGSADSVTTGTFGRYRQDGLYLLPAYVIVRPGALFLDYATHRTGFRLKVFPTDNTAALARLPMTRPAGTGPKPEALARMLRREYPGFSSP